MKHALTIKLLFPIIAFYLFQSVAFSIENCRFSTLKKLAIESPAAPNLVPLGMSEKAHATLVTFLDATMQKEGGPELIFLYGSRTHFSYGYKPTPESDLDVFPIFSQRDVQERIDGHFTFSDNLAKAVPEAGFPLKAQLPYGGDTKDFLWDANGQTPLLPAKNIAEQQKIWLEVATRANRENWDRDKIKNEYIRTQTGEAGGHIHREAIIYIRESPQTEAQEARLRELGFVTFIRVKPTR